MKSLLTVKDTSDLILQGKILMVAGDEGLLRTLPRGRWVGGTIPYFMTEEGGRCTHDLISVTVLPDFVTMNSLKLYDVAALSRIPADSVGNGFSYIVIPAFTKAHTVFANECASWPGIFDRPLVGWIAGTDLNGRETVKPKVFHGQTGEISETDAIVMHLELPKTIFAQANIINLFRQGDGDVITFPNSGFVVTDCFINGARQSFAAYIQARSVDVQNPLVADYTGAMINVSIRAVDTSAGEVTLYAPVFPGVEYKLAKPLADYEATFREQLHGNLIKPIFSCNCILNYLYAKLEGKKTGHMVGPITFGEIACMLLNQTMVYLTFEPATPAAKTA